LTTPAFMALKRKTLDLIYSPDLTGGARAH